MKNNYVCWGLIGGMFVSNCFISWPSGFFWLYYVFFCLFAIVLLLISKNRGI